MKTKKLKNLVKKAREELSWGVLEEEQASGPLRVFSDPVTRVHTIYLPSVPSDAGPVPELAYLHELGHALMCERVHPFFSSGFPIIGLDERLAPAVSPVLNVASDWFVGHWMTEFCHDVAIDELKKEFEATSGMMSDIMGKGEAPPVDRFFVAVLIIAQSIKYLKAPVECSGFLDSAVKAFLAVPPEKPSVGKLEDLINRLLSLGAPYRCRRMSREEQDVLEFYRVSEDGAC